jgi:hypothetical protein
MDQGSTPSRRFSWGQQRRRMDGRTNRVFPAETGSPSGGIIKNTEGDISMAWIHRLKNIDLETRTGDCASCGRVEVFKKKSEPGWRCRPEARRLGKIHQQRFMERRKGFSFPEIKISGCVFCGYSKCSWAIHFHHVYPSEKLFNIANQKKWIARHKEAMVAEMKKCIVVCANCHFEIHAGIIGQDAIENAPRAV